MAYHLHWPHDQIMRMSHRDRQRWVAEVTRINERLNQMARS